MRSRYGAYVLHLIDYIIATTVPAQQTFLDAAELMQWSREAEWLGLNVIAHRNLGKRTPKSNLKPTSKTAETEQCITSCRHS